MYLHIYDKPICCLGHDEASSTFASKLRSDVPEDFSEVSHASLRKGLGNELCHKHTGLFLA